MTSVNVIVLLALAAGLAFFAWLDAVRAAVHLQRRINVLEGLLSSGVDIVTYGDVVTGTCMCGDDMERHGNPMDAGHVPVDAGAYYASEWRRDAQRALGLDDELLLTEPTSVNEG